MNGAQNTRPACQVLVVGAGPTGLVLAADLLARGVSTRIIDKGAGVNLETRAIAIHARALEVLDLMGLAERFVDHGQRVRWFSFYTDGKPRLSLDLSRNGTRFPFMLDIPQHQTETLLRARVAELGGVVEQGTELTGLADGPAGVIATVRDADGQPRQITAGYVAGCDGAHSRVRHELGLPFRGHPYPQDWLLADVRLDWARSEDEVHGFFRADSTPLICFPMREHRWRLVVPFAGDRAPGPPDLAEIQRLVGQRAPEPVAVSEPIWLASFNCHRRSTDMYRRGHVLLAGDAVHIHSLTQIDRGRGLPRPGQRVPDIEVLTAQGPSRLFTVLRRGRHIILITGADPDRALANPALDPYRDLFVLVTCRSGDARAFRSTRAASVFLVRPDGYLAARARPDKLATVLGYLQELSRSEIGKSGDIVADQRVAEDMAAGVAS